MEAERQAPDQVHVDDVALLRVQPELVEVLVGLRDVANAMSAIFTGWPPTPRSTLLSGSSWTSLTPTVAPSSNGWGSSRRGCSS